QYEEFSLRYMGQVVDALTRNSEGRRVPNIVFTKGGGAWLDRIAAIGCDAAGVDWTTDLGDARKAVGGRVALQGNLDPSALFAPPPVLRAETLRVLESYGAGAGHVFNLGHGITPDVDPERVALLVKTVQEYNPASRRRIDARTGRAPPLRSRSNVQTQVFAELFPGARNSSRNGRLRILPTLLFGSS